MHAKSFSHGITAVLCWSLLADLVTSGRTNAQQMAEALNIIVVQAEGSINNIKQRTAREPIVQVEDQNHKPVVGAVVTFLAPQQGASGTFLNGARSIQEVTDMEGKAAAGKFQPNTVSGQFQIQVSASYDDKHANAVINQTNKLFATTTLGLSVKAWIIIGSIAAGAAAGAGIASTRGGGSGTTITPGSPTVGAPR